MKTRWKLFDYLFKGPGEYQFGLEGNKISIHVDANRVFETEGNVPQKIPLYAIASFEERERLDA